MKARVKATGDIIDVLYKFQTVEPNPTTKYETLNGERYFEEDVEFFEDGTPDYWTRLEHQYAGQFMQAMISSSNYIDVSEEAMADASFRMAHALVEKMKENEKAMH